MLDDTTAVHAEEIRQRQQRGALHLKMHHPNVPLKRLMQDSAVQAGDQEREEGDGGGAALGREGGVVDVVRGDVGQVGVGGVLLDVELVDEVEEDGVLLARIGELGGAVGTDGEAVGLVAVRWVGLGEGEEGGEEAHEGGEEGETHVGGWVREWDLERWWKRR